MILAKFDANRTIGSKVMVKKFYLRNNLLAQMRARKARKAREKRLASLRAFLEISLSSVLELVSIPIPTAKLGR